MPEFIIRRADWPVDQHQTVRAHSIRAAAEEAITDRPVPLRCDSMVHRYFDHHVVIFPAYPRPDGTTLNPATVFVRKDTEGEG